MEVTVNGKSITLDDESSVLDAINISGTPISQLCKDPDMKPIGACRTCLVQIDGVRGFPASCSTPANEGMKITTNSDAVEDLRNTVLELTAAMTPVIADKNGNNSSEFSKLLNRSNTDISKWDTRDREEVDDSNPVFNISMESCILCGRCAQACQSGHQFIGAIDVLNSGQTAKIGTFMDKPLLESICTTCGQCLSVCPTGAISTKELIPEIAETVTTTCPYCGVGCGIKAKVSSDDKIIEMLDDPENASSLGMLCVKGRFGYTFVHHEDRLTKPLVRKNGKLVPVTWDEALDVVSSKLSNYRGDSFATLCSAKATNEDGYIQQKFSRLVMQSNHIDHCTRLCHSPSVEAMLTSL